MPSFDTIKINGYRYNIDADPGVDGSVEIPQRYFTPVDDSNFWQVWESRSWQGGERRKRILAESQLTEMTYDDGENIDVSTWGELKLQPAIARSLTVQSAALPMVTSNDGSTVIVGHTVLSTKYISTFSGNPGSWTGRTTPNAAIVIDIIAATGSTLYAIQGSVASNKIITSTDNGATWSQLSSGLENSGTCQEDNGENTTTTIHLAAGASAVDDAYNGMTLIFTGGTGIGQTAVISDYDGTSQIATIPTVVAAADDTTTYEIWTDSSPLGALALAFCANQLYALTSSSLVYWDGAEWQEAASWGGSYACTYGEQVYFAKDNILYRYNGTSAFEADRLPQGFTITGLYPYRNLLFMPGYYLVQGGKKGAVYYIIDGRDAHMFNIGSYDGTSNNTISAVAGGDDEVYFSNQSRGGADRYDMSVGGLASGPAWGSAGVIPFKGMTYSNGKLFIARYDGVAGTDGVYICNIAIPTTWKTSGFLESAEYDWFFPHDYKVFSQLVVWHKALDVGESVTVDYSVNGGVSYVNAGVSSGVGTTTKTFKITNARGRSLKYKLTLAGDGTSTPTVTYFRADAAPMGEARSMWDFNLVMYSPMQGRQQILALKEAYNSQSVVELQDQYGDTHPVVFEFLRVQLLTGDKWTAKVQLRLREV